MIRLLHYCSKWFYFSLFLRRIRVGVGVGGGGVAYGFSLGQQPQHQQQHQQPHGHHHHGRNFDCLHDWAIIRNGVKLADGVKIQQVDAKTDDWTIVLEEGNARMNKKAGSVLMSVPQHLVLSSSGGSEETLPLLTDPHLLEEAFQELKAVNLEHHKAEFLLWLQLLNEITFPKWFPWFQSLPSKFTTGIEFSDVEMDCLPPFSRALVEYQQTILKTFTIIAETKQLFWAKTTTSTSSSPEQDDKMYRWAFNVVYSRCWQVSPTISHIVPMGDLFNHREPANVAVRYNNNNNPHEEDTVDFVLLKDMTTTTNGAPAPLYLSYGVTNPHRLLVLFGFVDESMPEIFCELVFKNPTPNHIQLGCQDRTKMVYRIGNGRDDTIIPQTVWDSILYALLEGQVPEDQDALITAHLEGDAKGKAKIHAKYALETALWLRNHVGGTIQELDDLLIKITKQQEQPPPSDHKNNNLPLIQTHNEFLKSAFEKVKAHLDDVIDRERELRRRRST